MVGMEPKRLKGGMFAVAMGSIRLKLARNGLDDELEVYISRL